FSADSNTIVARATGWKLEDLVTLFDLKDIEAQGEVNGTFPVMFSTGSAQLVNAELNASDRGGVLRYTGEAGEGASTADPNARMLFDALRDFRFTVMQVTLNGDLNDQIALGLNLLGRNPTVMNGQQFDLHLNINSPLMELLRLQDLPQRGLSDLLNDATRDGQ